MIYFVISLIMAFNGGVGYALLDWTPVAPGNRDFETGDCTTRLDGSPAWWTASEQCYDGSLPVSIATIQHTPSRFVRPGKKPLALRISGQFTMFRWWTPYGANAQHVSNEIVIEVPRGVPLTIQAYYGGGLPAEIYSIETGD